MPAIAQVAVTETWDDFAVVSSTMGAYQGRLCAGADRGDLGCPTYAPSLTTAGDVSVTGNLSASKFIGDGSALTGLSTTSDRITSGTSSVIVSQSGHISFTTAGTERMVINSSGNLGIGTSGPQSKLEIVGGSGTYLAISPTSNFNGLFGLRLTNAGGAERGFFQMNNATGEVRIGGGGGSFFPTFYSNGSERARIDGSGNVGIGTTAPTSALQVSGSFTVSTSAQTTTPSLYVASNGGVGLGTSAPSSAYGLDLVGSARFRLVGGLNPLYFDSGVGGRRIYSQGQDLQLLADNALIQMENASGNVGIGTTAPGETLDVSGTARIVSRTMIGGTGTPSATLQVSGSLLLAGSDSTTCNDAYIGILRRNPITGKLQVCK